jgi:hypothetical protein
MPLLAQIKLPQQPAPLVHAPPPFRQQLRAPSPSMPLLAQTVAPPACEHWDVELQGWPGARLPPPLLQTPLMQARLPQHPAPLVQSPPALLQQLSAPSPANPLSAQIKLPQHPAPLVQAPPPLRQQLSGPSEAIPLLEQTTAPPT